MEPNKPWWRIAGPLALALVVVYLYVFVWQLRLRPWPPNRVGLAIGGGIAALIGGIVLFARKRGTK